MCLTKTFLLQDVSDSLVLLRIWKPCAHRQTAIPKFSYLDKYVFIVRVPYLCLMGITCVRCEVSFTTNLLHFTPHTDAIAHVHSTTYVDGDFHHLSSDSTPCPITHRGRLSYDTPANRVMRARLPRTWAEIFIASAPTPPLVQSRTKGDFPMIPRPMRVEMPQRATFPRHPSQ